MGLVIMGSEMKEVLTSTKSDVHRSWFKNILFYSILWTWINSNITRPTPFHNLFRTLLSSWCLDRTSIRGSWIIFCKVFIYLAYGSDRMLLKVGILVQEVTLREQSWKKLKQTKNMAPNLYVTIEYGDESIRTQTVKDTLSPSFSHHQFIIRP